MLEVRQLVAGYGVGTVLDGIDFFVAPGEAVGLFGGRGAGKSSLYRVLSGLLPPSAGQVRFMDDDITGADPADIMQAGLVHVPQGGRVFRNLTVRENLLLGATRRGRAARPQMLGYVLGNLPPLRAWLGRPAGTLHPAEQQLVAIGRGLMAGPRLLLLDEPCAGLPPHAAASLFALLAELHLQGIAILLNDGNTDQVLALANRAYVLEAERVTLHGQVED